MSVGAQSGGTSEESVQERHMIRRKYILKGTADSGAVMKEMTSIVH